MRRLIVLTMFVGLVLPVTAADAQVGSPHFVGNLTYAQLSGENLVVHFKEAGLPSGATETITASATVTEQFFCVNLGGANPAASNKRSFTTEVSVSGTFTADKNGNVIGTLTIEPVSPPSDFSCPPGQTLVLGSVTYSDVTITDETSGATFSIEGTFSTGCLLPAGTRLKKGITCP